MEIIESFSDVDSLVQNSVVGYENSSINKSKVIFKKVVIYSLWMIM